MLGEAISELRPLIEQIEKSIPTTQNHYGFYLSILSRYPDKKELVAKLLIMAGANKDGVLSALEILR